MKPKGFIGQEQANEMNELNKSTLQDLINISRMIICLKMANYNQPILKAPNITRLKIGNLIRLIAG